MIGIKCQKSKIHQKSEISECVHKCLAFLTFEHVRKLRFQTKSQTAVELIIILAIALVIFISILSINENVTSSVSNRFEVTKAKTSLEDLANAAELVYQQGIGAKTKVYITIPNNVNSVSISGQTLSINMYSGGNPRDVYRTVDFAVSGNIPTEEGNYWVTVEAMDAYVAIGEIVITCPDGACGTGENCPADSNACTDNVCYNPACTNGCGQTAIINNEDPGECDSTAGCISPPCYCDSSSNCVSVPAQVCGNNIKEGTEICDGTDLNGQNCQSQGYDAGILACFGDCTAFDTSSCYNYVCGNNVREGTEVCDGTDLAGQTCQSQGFDAGTLACFGDCTGFDASGCLNWQTIFLEDFEANWGCRKTTTPASTDECTVNNPWGNFDYCDDNTNDYLFCTTDDGQEGSHTTYALQMVDWDIWDSNRGVYYSFDPRIYSGIIVEGYMAAASLDSINEFCRIWVKDSDSWATIYQCVNNAPVGCEAGDATPEQADYIFFSADLSTLSGISLTDPLLEIHIGGQQSGTNDYCFWDRITIKGLS